MCVTSHVTKFNALTEWLESRGCERSDDWLGWLSRDTLQLITWVVVPLGASHIYHKSCKEVLRANIHRSVVLSSLDTIRINFALLFVLFRDWSPHVHCNCTWFAISWLVGLCLAALWLARYIHLGHINWIDWREKFMMMVNKRKRVLDGRKKLNRRKKHRGYQLWLFIKRYHLNWHNSLIILIS